MIKKKDRKYTRFRVKVKHQNKVWYFDTISLDFEPARIVEEISILS